MRVGIGSWTFPWSIGVAGYPTPPTPLDARGLLKLAGELRVHALQICDNYPLHRLSANELATIHSTAQAMEIRVEVGTRGVDPAHLLRYLDVAQALGSASVRTVLNNRDVPYLEYIKQVMPRYAAAGVALALENNEALSAVEYAALVKAVESPYFGITLDTVNSLGRSERMEEVAEHLLPFVINVHYKDYAIVRVGHRMGFNIVGRPAGEGWVNGRWLLDNLVQTGKDVAIIVELWPPFVNTIEETIANEQEGPREASSLSKTWDPVLWSKMMPTVNIVGSRIIDLSQTIQSGMPVPPGFPTAKIEMLLSQEQGGRANVELVTLSTHVGTHVDAQYHFFSSLRRVDELPPGCLIGPAVVVDMTCKCGSIAIEATDLQAWEETANQSIQPEDIVLLRTGHSENWKPGESAAAYWKDGWPYLASRRSNTWPPSRSGR